MPAHSIRIAALAALVILALSATPSSSYAGRTVPMPTSLPGIDLPAYQPPPAYSVNLVVHSPRGEMTMKRIIDHQRIRSEMTSQGQSFVMIEMGDEKGTMLTLMPDQKRGMTQTSATMKNAMAMAPMSARAAEKTSEKKPEASAPPPDLKAEDLGDETIDGHAAKKVRMTSAEGTALGWFDKATGAPLRMESDAGGQKTVLEWKDYQVAPQPATLFEAPKGYEITDMDEMMAKMSAMQGGHGMAGMGGLGNMAGGYANGMAQSFGQNMGASLGSSFGAALGGPLGAIAGQYIGGKIGGMVAKKAADAVLPGPH
ncbi:MAG TPA: hypothetical protein VL123_06925 [Candidatus Udaeobacter sp.]|jgi:hypothetical protein|nr:hypothetical protein [Candidatus Udaeobacter sp.]